MARRNQRGASSATKLKLPARAITGLKKMGWGRELRMMNKILKGETWHQPEVDRLCPPTRKLNRAFDTISPSLNPELSGDFVSRCVSCMIYVALLSEHLRELARLNRQSSPKELRSLLATIYDSALWGLRRQANGLRRDIVRLIEELGGDPSEELLLPRKRGWRRPSRSAR
jgi:hypothetical protein